MTNFSCCFYKSEVQYISSKEEPAADAVEAGAGHSIYIHSEANEGWKEKITLCELYNLCGPSNTGTRRGAVGRDTVLQATKLPIRFPTALLT